MGRLLSFDLVIVGGGSGNSIIGRDLGHLSIALIDDGEHFGGTCLNAGCIPSTMFVHAADLAANTRDAARLGIDLAVTRVDWSAIRNRVFARTDGLSAAGFRNRVETIPNVTVFRESFRFESTHELVSASGVSIRGERIVIAAGSRPRALDGDVARRSTTLARSQWRVLADGAPVPGVYGLGDVSSAWQLKHVANHQARVVKHNILHPDDLEGGDPGPVPSTIFSRPQLAHFGLTEADAPDAVVVTRDYSTTAYGWALEDETSFCKLVVDRVSGLILGAHIIGPQASILIQPLILAAAHQLPVQGLARSQYWPHPALSEVVENALLDAEREVSSER